MSTGALLLAVAGPPMSEHVTEGRGVNFGHRDAQPWSFAHRYPIDGRSLEQAVRRVLGMAPPEREARGRRARQYFLNNDRAFAANTAATWRSLVAGWAHAPRLAASSLPPYARDAAAVSAAETFRAARDLHRGGRVDEAVELYRRVLDAEPENGEALHFMALALYQQGHRRGAYVGLFRSLQVNPDRPCYYRNAAAMLAQDGRAGESAAFRAHADRLARRG